MRHHCLIGIAFLTAALPLISQAAEQPKSSAPRPYLGARLSADIPDLLRTHLQIEPDQGLRIENIFRNSPADKAGLDKDDILLTLEGNPLKEPGDLYRRLRELGVGTVVTVEFVHRGQRKSTQIMLEPMAPEFRSDKTNWKYPLEPEESIVIRPGRMFQMRPGQREWIEIPIEQLKQTDTPLPNLGAQYHFLHNDGQTEFTVVISGNPNEPDASVTVKTADKEYFTTAAQIDKLPDAYQQSVRLDIEKAKRSYDRGKNLKIPARIDASQWQQLFGQTTGQAKTDASEQTAQVKSLMDKLLEIENRQKAIEAYLKEKFETINRP